MLAECAAVWVYIESAGGRPQPLEPDFFEIYGRAAGGPAGERASASSPPGAGGGDPRPWPLRDSDFDVLDHVNNARYFEAVEDELAPGLPGLVVGRAEMEFRGAVERGVAVDLASEVHRAARSAGQLAVWLVVDGEVRARRRVVTARVRDPDRRVHWPRSGPLASSRRCRAPVPRHRWARLHRLQPRPGARSAEAPRSR